MRVYEDDSGVIGLSVRGSRGRFAGCLHMIHTNMEGWINTQIDALVGICY